MEKTASYRHYLAVMRPKQTPIAMESADPITPKMINAGFNHKYKDRPKRHFYIINGNFIFIHISYNESLANCN